MRKFIASFLAIQVALILALTPVASAGGFKFSYSKVTPKYPCQYSTVTYKARIVTNSGSYVKNAKVTFKVHYKTTTTSYSAGYTNSLGKASKNFWISGATPNYKVYVKSKATKNGNSVYSTTSFTPQKCS